jgi:hypothetical protein
MKRFTLGVALCTAILWAYTATGHNSPPPQTTKPQVTIRHPEPSPTTIGAQTTTQAPITTTTWPVLVDYDSPCQEWVPLALEVGWPADRQVITKLLAVMNRESRCQPDVISKTHDYGLMQINRSAHHARIESWGLTMDSMLDPRWNLTYALWLYNDQGWRPWRFSGGA